MTLRVEGSFFKDIPLIGYTCEEFALSLEHIQAAAGLLVEG